MKSRHPLIPVATFLLPLLFLFGGCGSTLQSGWTDFNAYFNTYYNAKTSFSRGVEQIERQQETINPERPIRIHPTPPQAGRQEFEKAMEKSADILRFHPESRYVDNAIEIIGKSFFYQNRFFPASQKFLELYSTTSNEVRRQNAVLWRGRSLLELQSYTEGLTYLSSQLFSADFDWDPQIEAEIKLVMAQMHVYSRNWEEAEQYLAEGKEDIRDRQLYARANFLHGQVLERLGRYDEAFDAYDQAIHRANPEFSVTFNAKLKKGQTARKMGDYQWAYDFFVSMSRDDKFYEFFGDLLYEIARTIQDSGDLPVAEEEYRNLLKHDFARPSRPALARTYYGLAEIFRDHYNDYPLAAAFYDSASRQATDLSLLPENFDASLLSRSYGQYAELVERAAHLDSLLWLGSLPEDEFEKAIETVRRQKIQELQRQREEQRRSGDIVITEDDLEMTDAASSTENGFLNHLNPQLMNQVGQTFRAYWGNRPLVDDWRRAGAVRAAIISQREEDEESDAVSELSEEDFLAETRPPDEQVLVDLSGIPFTPEEQQAVREQIAATSYEIGNVFFLTLNMPDSAKNRYAEVIERFPESSLAPQAWYSLSETHRSVSDSVKAREIALELIEKFPKTLYARRMAGRYNVELAEEPEENKISYQDSLTMIYHKVVSELEEGYRTENAEKLKNFAYRHSDSEKAPLALFRAATEYIRMAGQDAEYRDRVYLFREKQEEWNRREMAFNQLQDSSAVMLSDSTLSKAERQKWQTLADSTLSRPDLSEYFPYQGAHWDSARVLLADLSENHSGFPAIRQAERLKEEIRLLDKEPDIIPGHVYAPHELDNEPELITDLEDFFQMSGLQDQINSMMMSGLVVLKVIIDEEGMPVEIKTEDEDAEGLGIMDNLIEAAGTYFRFTPPTRQGVPVMAGKEIHIPIDYQ